MAGKPIVCRKQRARTVRPRETNNGNSLHPLQGDEFGDMKAEQVEKEQGEKDGGEQEEMEKLDANYQQLRDKMKEYVDDEHGKPHRSPPMVKASKSADSRRVRTSPDHAYPVCRLVKTLCGRKSYQDQASHKGNASNSGI